jgi:hypothetical protein
LKNQAFLTYGGGQLGGGHGGGQLGGGGGGHLERKNNRIFSKKF